MILRTAGAPFSGTLRRDVPLAPLTTWRVGGRADWLCEPRLDETPALLDRCSETGTPVFFLGRGSNVLISDTGVPGLVVYTGRSLGSIAFEKDCVIAQAGVPLPQLAQLVSAHGFGGYEFLAGIPGTLGGGVVMNAGLKRSSGLSVGSLVLEAETIVPGLGFKRRSAADLAFGYRRSTFLDRCELLVGARLALLDEIDPALAREKIRDHLRERRNKQPIGRRTAGSTFREPEGEVSAGWYVEQAGLKGHRIGGAIISRIHANWIENTGAATAADIRALIHHVQDVVYDRFGVALEREVRYLPEDTYRV